MGIWDIATLLETLGEIEKNSTGICMRRLPTVVEENWAGLR